jgi:hypothetical protein
MARYYRIEAMSPLGSHLGKPTDKPVKACRLLLGTRFVFCGITDERPGDDDRGATSLQLRRRKSAPDGHPSGEGRVWGRPAPCATEGRSRASGKRYSTADVPGSPPFRSVCPSPKREFDAVIQYQITNSAQNNPASRTLTPVTLQQNQESWQKVGSNRRREDLEGLYAPRLEAEEVRQDTPPGRCPKEPSAAKTLPRFTNSERWRRLSSCGACGLSRIEGCIASSWAQGIFRKKAALGLDHANRLAPIYE